jgi:hypothetical protein
MGHTEFLVGLNQTSPSSLPVSIDDLQDTSTVFMQRWKSRDFGRAGDISQHAMILLDFIVSEFLRERGDRLGKKTYAGSVFEAEMTRNAGRGVTGVTAREQTDMVALGPGNGRIPAGVGTPVDLTLERLLNKIKHRNHRLINFRIESGRHIFLICPEKSNGKPEGISEFDVADFCDHCKAAAAAL